MSDAGVSLHVAALRKELDDALFTKTGAGLAFTPGGLRWAIGRSRSSVCNNKPRSR
jgi:DNA-binding transcriptional LysR family regulator